MNAHSPQKFDKFTLRSNPISRHRKIYSLKPQSCIHLCMCAVCSCQLGLHLSTYRIEYVTTHYKREAQKIKGVVKNEYPHDKGEGPPVKGLRLVSAHKFPTTSIPWICCLGAPQVHSPAIHQKTLVLSVLHLKCRVHEQVSRMWILTEILGTVLKLVSVNFQ